VRLIVGVILLTILAVLALSASESDAGKRRVEQMLMGALVVAGAVYVLARAGMPWLAVGLVFLYSAARRLANRPSSPSGQNRPPPQAAPPTGPMSREEAYQVLGLTPGASPDQIRSEYRRLMKKVHPDQGGTTYLAARINEAKEVLLGSS
jgi:DnaJ-domain-containing protein 1